MKYTHLLHEEWRKKILATKKKWRKNKKKDEFPT